jgi:hypothetical protein
VNLSSLGRVADWFAAHVLEILRYAGLGLIFVGLLAGWLVSRRLSRRPDEFQNRILVKGKEILSGRPYTMPACTLLIGLTLALQNDFVTSFTVLGILTLVTGGDWVISAITAWRKGKEPPGQTDATATDKNEKIARDAELQRASAKDEKKPPKGGASSKLGYVDALAVPTVPSPRPLSAVMQEAWKFEATATNAILRTPEFKKAEFKRAFKLRTTDGERLVLDGAFARPGCIYLVEFKHLIRDMPLEPMAAQVRHYLRVYQSWNESAVAPRPSRAILVVSRPLPGEPPQGDVFVLVVNPANGVIQNEKEFHDWLAQEPSFDPPEF